MSLSTTLTHHHPPHQHVIVRQVDPPLSAMLTFHEHIWALVQPTRWLPPLYAQHLMYIGACSSFNLLCSSHHCICWCSPYCCSRLLVEKQLSFIPILPIGPVSTGYEPVSTITGWDWSCNCRKTETNQYRLVLGGSVQSFRASRFLKTGLGLSPSLSKVKDQTGPDL